MSLTQEQIDMLTKASNGDLLIGVDERPEAIRDLINAGLLSDYARIIYSCGLRGGCKRLLSFSLTEKGKAVLADAEAARAFRYRPINSPTHLSVANLTGDHSCLFALLRIATTRTRSTEARSSATSAGSAALRKRAYPPASTS